GQNLAHPLNKCTDCHDVHALTVKVDACKGCHTNVAGVEDLEKIRATTDTTDWNGNGDTTEGVFAEIDTFRQTLFAAIQNYAETKAGLPIVYDANAYPYFFADADKDGKPDTKDNRNVSYNAWTPRLLKAAYNYQYSIKDPGAFAHNPMYVMQFLYDSIKDLGGDVSKLTRP
ncbi:MAG: polyheme membrane-associated cytochrome C, partial [Bacteroidota bacterium]